MVMSLWASQKPLLVTCDRQRPGRGGCTWGRKIGADQGMAQLPSVSCLSGFPRGQAGVSLDWINFVPPNPTPPTSRAESQVSALDTLLGI